MNKLTFMGLLVLSGCGGHVSGFTGGQKQSSSSQGIEGSATCERVESYYAAVEAEHCDPYIPPPAEFTEASCEQASVDLDFCYSQPDCWLAMQQQNVATCRSVPGHELIPQWEAAK